MDIAIKNGSTIINGKQYVGKNISIRNGVVTVDGVQQEGALPQHIIAQVIGEVDRIDGNVESVTVSGPCGSVRTVSGDVKCGDVMGNVQTVSGDVSCGDIGGNVKTVSGDVK